MLKRFSYLAIIALLALCAGLLPANAQSRIALVIGNQGYAAAIGRLANPHNDIALLEQTLKQLRFEVIVVRDAGLAALHQHINAYARRLKAAGPDAVGFFYYSGHGAADGATNYLIPVDVRSAEDGELWDHSLQLTEITRKLKRDAGNATHFVVFDACRNVLKLRKPGSRALVQAKGFAAVAQESGMLIAYATAEGELASDVGQGAGPYARVLAEEIVKPGIEAVAMFRVVQRRVRAAISQEPYLGFNALGDVYFAGSDRPAGTAPPLFSEAERAWISVKDSTNQAVLEAFARQFSGTVYGAMAQARIEELKQRQVAAAPPPAQPSAPLAAPKPPAPPAATPPGTKSDLAMLDVPKAQPGTTLSRVRSRGHIICGVSVGLAGFSLPDSKGEWSGLDADYCRAVAAAVFGDATRVKFTPLSARDRFTALQSGEVDILARNSTWTMSRDSSLGLTFAGVLYYDGQGFIARTALRLNSAAELNGAFICLTSGTTTELDLSAYFRASNTKFTPLAFPTVDEAVKAYLAGRCDVYSTDASVLFAIRAQQPRPEEHSVLPEIISKEPLGPMVRQNDDQWLKIARWTLFALIAAEELGVTRANVEQSKASTHPEIMRLLGVEPLAAGAGLALDRTWAAAIIKAVGNYGELFERSFGANSSQPRQRGLNALWRSGGLMYAPPFR